jgi:superfamily I DNA/RNA helicase
MVDVTPTPEQEAIVDFARNDKRSLLVSALAGSAKTTTLVMMAHKMKLVPTLSVAFNKRISEEMQKRMPSHIQSATLNSLGHRAWAQTVGHRLILNTDKVYDKLTELFAQLRSEEKDELSEGFPSILRAIRSAKSMGYVPDKFKTLGQGLCSEEDFYESVTPSFDIEPTKLVWKLIDDVLCHGITEGFEGKIDFDDQLYLSTLFGSSFTKYPVTLVDETQDLSPLNHKMLEKMFGGRLIAVGDKNQSIYKFRGASTQSMGEMKAKFEMEELILSTSFRCPRTVIRRLQKRVPHMTWPEWAIEGEVNILDTWSPSTPPNGSAVICRNNAPLFRTAMTFIRASRGVQIIGNDIGASLIKLLKKMGENDDSGETIRANIEDWRSRQLAAASKSRHAPINDRADCLLVFVEAGDTLRDMVAFADHLFKASGPVQFMTGHKAKGAEFTHVYYLDSFLIPSKHARMLAEFGDTSDLEQERNLDYVICSRAKQTLNYVNSEDLTV